MILTVNIGNTHITIAGYEHDTLQFSGRLHSSPAATVDEYAMNLLNLLSLYQVAPERIEGGILGSVVPALTSCGWTTLPSWAQSCYAVLWPHWKRDPDRWRSSRQIPPSPLWQSTADRSWWAVSSCQGRSSLFPHWCKKPPSCPRSTSPLQLPPRSWARTPLPAYRTVLCWAPPGCWTGWPSVFRQSLARISAFMPPATCPAPSGRPAARPFSTGSI